MAFKLIQGNEYRCTICGAIVLLTDDEVDDPEHACPDCGSLSREGEEEE